MDLIIEQYHHHRSRQVIIMLLHLSLTSIGVLVVFACCFLTTVHGQSPMLVYNCAKMPSICRNVHRRNPLQIVTGVANANTLGELDTGQTPGGLPYITLH